MEPKSKFKVIIIGGGIAGLSLANSLQHANIDFVVLEKRDRLDPELGASVGILPNGARILDQLGCFDDLEEVSLGMETTSTRRQDGSLIGRQSDTLKLMEIRSGYPVFFLERQLLLRVLADHILDHSRIVLNASVQAMEQSSDRCVVKIADGTSIEGDIVVGADGVHSFVRREMWRHAKQDNSDVFELDKRAMFAEYKCIFGISHGIPGMFPGQTDRTYSKDVSTLSYVGKGGVVFWFVFVKMDQVYHCPYIPRFTEADIESLINKVGSLPIRDDPQITVRHLYHSRRMCNLMAIEEAEYDKWSYGRLVCVGDSIHKTTPNLGAGASSALESTAALSNAIVRLATTSAHPSMKMVSQAFQRYYNARALRTGRAMKFSSRLTRVQALESGREYLYTHFIAPRTDDIAAEIFSSFVIGASLIDHLPIPARSLRGTMPFNPKQGWGFEEAKLSRILRAVPLLIFAVTALIYRSMETPGSLFESRHGANLQDSPRCDPTIAVLSDVIYGIWLLESTRLNNKFTLAQYPSLFGLAAQQLGMEFVAPIYFFLLYIGSSIEKFRASDNRLTDSAYSGTAGPLIVLLGMLPKLNTCWASTAHEVWNLHMFPQMRPLVLSAAQFLLAEFLLGSTIRYDRLWAVRRDVFWIRCSIGILVAASGTAWICGVVRAVLSEESLCSVTNLGWHIWSLVVSNTFWIMLVHGDFKAAGMVQDGSETIILAMMTMLTLVCFGPGAAVGLTWLWREEIFLGRRHENAVIGPT